MSAKRTLWSCVFAIAVVSATMWAAAVQQQSGTSIVTGVVSDDNASPRPLRRAIVTISGDKLPVARSVITDDNGRYTIQSLPAGRITVTASKRGYVNGSFGARRAGGPGTPMELRAGESVTANVQLFRAAVLTGVIRNERGVPIPGLRVFALAASKPEAPQPVGPVSAPPNLYTLTDDRGMYRLYDLAPGKYIVAAVPVDGADGEIGRRSVAENDAILGRLGAPAANQTAAPIGPPAETAALAPIFFPGTSSLKNATRIALAPGDVRAGLDFTAIFGVRVTTVEGIVTGAAGSPIEISIAPEDSIQFFALGTARPKLIQAPGPDGRFKYGTIMPGHYVIWARAGVDLSGIPSRGGGAAPDAVLGGGRGGGEVANAQTTYAMAEVDIAGQPVGGVTLQLRPGSRISGKVTLDTDGAPLADLSTIRVTPAFTGRSDYSTSGTTSIGNRFSSPRPAAVSPDGTFDLVGIAPGAYTLQVILQPQPTDGRKWWSRSATWNDRDLLDAGLVMRPGEDFSNVSLTLTDRRSEIAGTLQTAPGVPAPEYFVVAMPADPALWTPAAARRQKFTRPATDGSFSFLDLPPGDYLIAALTDLDPNGWPSADVLTSIAPAGVKVSLGINQRVRQDLQIRR